MPQLMPFRAWRYAPGTDLAAVTAPPYDVLSPADVDALRAQDPHNIVHVDVPPQTPAGYAGAAATLHAWAADGTLVRDPKPTFTLYRLTFEDAAGTSRSMIGVLAALPVADFGTVGVLPHERVTAKDSTDRLDLTRATNANLSPVWGLSLVNGLSNVLETYWDLAQQTQHKPSYCSDSGVTHDTAPIDDPVLISVIQTMVAQGDVLIADGHHRYGVAQRYRDEVRTGVVGGYMPVDFTLAFISELVADQLNIDAIHRVYDGVPFDTLRDALARDFDLAPAPAPTPGMLDEMVASSRLVLLSPDGQASWMTPKPGVFNGVRPLDGLWLEQTLQNLDALQVTYQHGLAETLAAVPNHSGAVLIRPTTIDEIRRTATEGLLMPPKSTFFTPKLQTGLVVRTLDE